MSNNDKEFQVKTLKPSQLSGFNYRKKSTKFQAALKEKKLLRAMNRKFKARQEDSNLSNSGDGGVIICGFFIALAMVVLYTTFQVYGLS
jgi:hypothetical protein